MSNKEKNKLTPSALAEIIGCSERALRTMRNEGLPGRKRKNRIQYDPLKVKEWLLATGRIDKAQLLEDWLEAEVTETVKNELKNRLKAEEKLPESGSKAEVPDINVLLAGDDVDLFQIKEMIGKEFVESIVRAKKLSGAKKAAETRTMQLLSAEYRHLEMACIDIDEKLGRVCPIEEVIAFIGRMTTQVKTDMRSLPFSLAGRLAAEEDPKKIIEIIKTGVEDALRHLDKKFRAADSDTE